jgi:PAT family beta-lactamase induction signal transducer AmpG
VIVELASGWPYAVVNELAPVWLKTQGVGNAAIGAMSLLVLPWSLKAAFGPFVDRLGTIRGWMVGGALACAAGTLAVGLGAPLIPALVVLALCSACADVAIDGWAVAVVPPGQQARATGARIGAYRAALALGGGGAIVLGARVGWEWAFVVSALALVVLAAAMTRLPNAPRPPAQSTAEWLRVLATWISQPGALVFFAWALLYKLGDAAMAPMTKPAWLDAGIAAEEVGAVFSTAGAICVVLGAVAGGEVLARGGLLRGGLVLGGIQAVTNLGYAAAAMHGTRTAFYSAAVAESLGQGLGSAAAMAIGMRACGSEQAATRYAAYTAVVALARALVGSTSGLGADRWGYPAYFAMTFALALPGLALMIPVARRLDG